MNHLKSCDCILCHPADCQCETCLAHGVPFPEDRPDHTLFEECPRCERHAILATGDGGSFTFNEPLCSECRSTLERQASMDDFDRAYERARANGWPD